MKKDLTTKVIYFICSIIAIIILIKLEKTQETQGLSPRALNNEKNSKDEIEADGPDNASEQNFSMTQDPILGYVPSENLENVYSINNTNARLASNCVTWHERGPGNIGGRTRAIMFDPNDPAHKKVWAGGISGGLWYTDDITVTSPVWNKVDDYWDNLSIGAIAFDPSNPNIFYVGTGEGYYTLQDKRGAGIWKSTSGGASGTWSRLSSTIPSTADPRFFYTQKIIINSAGEIFVATRDGGIQKSSNGGVSFIKVLGSGLGDVLNALGSGTIGPATDDVVDLEIAANGTMYACTGISNLGAIYRSQNGTNWIRISDSNTPSGFATIGTFRRIKIACAASNSNVIYAFVVDMNNSLQSVYRSNDEGNHWVLKNIPGFNPLAWYDVTGIVDPTDENIIYSNNQLNIRKSTNGGTSWSNFSVNSPNSAVNYVHADQQAYLFTPGTSTTTGLLVACDGGVFFTNDINQITPSFSSKNGNLSQGYRTTQFYSCAIHPDASSNIFIGGTQDNENIIFQPGSINLTDGALWGLTSDGGYCFIDKIGTNERYIASTQWVNYSVSSTGAPGSFTPLVNHGPNTGRFINPADYDYVNHILFVNKNFNAIERIDGIFATPTNTLIPIIDGSNSMTGFPSSIKVSPYSTLGHSTLFIGTGFDFATGTPGGQFWKVTDANSTTPSCTLLTPPTNDPGSYISCIEVGASDNQLLVTYSNYTTSFSNVYESSNGGLSWIPKDGNLPNFPVRWALYNPLNRKEVFLATELGVWSCTGLNASSPDWNRTSAPLANTRIDMLRFRASDKIILAATHGRGLFSTDYFNHPNAAFAIPVPGSCINQTLKFIDQSTNNATGWSWNFGDPASGGSNLSNQQNPIHRFSQNGVFQVTLTVSNSSGCNSITQTILVQSAGTCCATFSDTKIEADFNSGVAITGLANLSSPSLNIVIQSGNVAIVDNAQLAIPTGMKITVSTGATLKIQNSSHLFACGNMWEGIVVEQGGNVEVSENSIIEDAEHAIYSKAALSSNSTIIVTDAEFRNNYIGVFVEPNTSGYNNLTLNIVGASFTCTRNLIPSNNINPIGIRSYAGIELNDINCRIGKKVGATNYFNNLHYGILSHRSFLTVRNSSFTNIRNDATYGSFFGGVGVYSDGSDAGGLLKVRGDFDPSFSACDQGIHSDGITLEVHNNHMVDVGIGVYTYMLPRGSANLIYHNIIECSQYGVFTYFSDDVAYLDINFNSITNSGGIGIGDYDFGSRRNIIIENNTINLNNGISGIQISGASNHFIYKNTIYVANNNPDVFSGISLTASDKNSVSCNTVTGDNASNGLLQYGYYISKSVENNVTCNVAQTIPFGFEFDGSCNMHQQFTGNVMTDNFIGLNLSFSGVISQQTHRGNVWTPGTFGSGNEAVNSNNPSTSRFLVNPGDGVIFNPGNPLPTFGWFNPDPSGNFYNCDANIVCPKDGGSGGSGNGSFEMMIAGNTYSPPDFPDESKWMAKRDLFEKINDNPSLLNEILLSNFYFSYRDSSVGAYSEIKDSILVMDVISNSDSTMLATSDSLIKTHNLELELNDSLFNIGLIDTATFQINYDSLIYEIVNLKNGISILFSELRLEENQKADEMKILNSAMYYSREVEENEKTVNDIYLNTLAKNIREFNAGQKSSLLSIAHQCPFAGGNSVYHARSMCLLFTLDEYYDDFATCTQLGLFRKRNSGSVTSLFSFPFPNPASGNITFSYSVLNNSDFKLLIYTNTMQLISSENLGMNEVKKKININSYTPGLYIYTIVQNDQVISTGKFSVIR